MDQQKTPTQTPPKGYGKRPLWQWVLLYVVVGGLIYLLIWYLFIRSSSGGGY